MSIFILLVSLAVWGYVHSLLASHAAKAAMKLGRWHRLAYNTFALLTFAPILYLMRTLPDRPIYQVPAPWNILMFGGQSLTVYLGATIYILIGAYFEEKKLVGEFGDAYTDYKRRTPMLIPGLMFRAG
jgi:hypothetical protein